jgi:molecular chaperone DnaK
VPRLPREEQDDARPQVRVPTAARPPEPADDVVAEIEQLRMRPTGVIIGIDLGTTFTCASYVKDGRPQIIPSRTGTNTIPSMITFDPDGTWYVGQRAADRQVMYPLRTVYGTKRLVGRTYRAELAAELQQHFAYPLGEADGRRFGVRIDDRVISMDTIAARVLDEVRSTAEAHLGRSVEAAVITVPAYFSEVQREAVRRAAREANLVVHRIVNEPTAAAVAYGHKRPQGKPTRVAVWDFGGGTFDFSIVDVDDGQLEVLCTGGDNFVGGTDFDDILASHLLAEFQRGEGSEVDPSPQQVARLREVAEATKRALSVETEHVAHLPDFAREPSRALRVEVTRARFEALTRPLVDRTLAIAREVMAQRGLAPADIDDVLLIGGTTRIPAVQQAVADLFHRRPSKRINPDEAVAIGAALLADEIGSASAPTLLDILPMSVGRGVSGLRFEPLVARNARLPAERDITLDADLLGNVTVPLFQGDSPDVSANEYLCSVIVEDRSLWDKGKVSLRLSFDEHCVMAIEARNARTGRALPTRLDRSRSVEDVLRELGTFEGPPAEARWQAPPTRLGRALGKLFKLFGR